MSVIVCVSVCEWVSVSVSVSVTDLTIKLMTEDAVIFFTHVKNAALIHTSHLAWQWLEQNAETCS
jgi:hypothetical protein